MEARPNYGFLGEEGTVIEGKDPTRRWIVDPLDGTTNFLHAMPHWAVSIGLEHKGEIVAGVVYDPAKDEMFYAREGRGLLAERQQAVAGVGAHQDDRERLRHRRALRWREIPACHAAGSCAADARLRRRAALGVGGAGPRLCGGGSLRGATGNAG